MMQIGVYNKLRKGNKGNKKYLIIVIDNLELNICEQWASYGSELMPHLFITYVRSKCSFKVFIILNRI
jgi:hypothetical protein